MTVALDNAETQFNTKNIIAEDKELENRIDELFTEINDIGKFLKVDEKRLQAAERKTSRLKWLGRMVIVAAAVALISLIVLSIVNPAVLLISIPIGVKIALAITTGTFGVLGNYYLSFREFTGDNCDNKTRKMEGSEKIAENCEKIKKFLRKRIKDAKIVKDKKMQKSIEKQAMRLKDYVDEYNKKAGDCSQLNNKDLKYVSARTLLELDRHINSPRTKNLSQ